MKNLFEEIPVIENERLILKRLTYDDTDGIRELTEDPEVYKYLPTFLFEKQFDDLHEMTDKLYGDCFKAKDSLILGICLKEEGSFCGLAEFYAYKKELHKTCIGYRLMRNCWGRGIASETVSLMLGYLFNETDVEIVTASTMVGNKASARVLEKNGFINTAKAVPEDWGYPVPTLADKWFR